MDWQDNYRRKLLDLWRAGKLWRGIGHRVCVYHDDDCAFWRGGPCDCDPDIRVYEVMTKCGKAD